MQQRTGVISVETSTWIWIAIAIVVVVVLLVVLVSLSSRRRAAKEIQAKEDRARAVELREAARVSELDSREKNATAMRKAAEAEQAAVAAERLSVEAEHELSKAAEVAARSREKLAQADALDPGFHAKDGPQAKVQEDQRTRAPDGEEPAAKEESQGGRHTAVEEVNGRDESPQASTDPSQTGRGNRES